MRLGETEVSDAGLEHLKELPNLKHLVVTFCPGVTEASVEGLKAALPDLTVEY